MITYILIGLTAAEDPKRKDSALYTRCKKKEINKERKKLGRRVKSGVATRVRSTHLYVKYMSTGYKQTQVLFSVIPMGPRVTIFLFLSFFIFFNTILIEFL